MWPGFFSLSPAWEKYSNYEHQPLFTKEVIRTGFAHLFDVQFRIRFFVPRNAGHSDGDCLCGLDRTWCGGSRANGHSVFQRVGRLEAPVLSLLHHRWRGRTEAVGIVVLGLEQ